MMRWRSSIVIRGEDHLADALGAIFLLEAERAGDAAIEKLRDYLGARTRVLKATISRDRVEVEVESTGLREEADRLVAAAAGLSARGLYRLAEPALREALKLDPLNPRALRELGKALHECEEFSAAIAILVRARETAGVDDAELLAMLGACCVKVERNAAAAVYFEHALELEPRHFAARRALIALGRAPAPRARPRAREGGAPKQSHSKQ